MKKTATITINDKIITVTEITIKQMLTIKDKYNNASVIEAMQELFPILTDATPEFLLDLAPSELEDIYEKVKEVNASFLKLLPLDKILVGYQEVVIQGIRKSLLNLYAKSSLPDMG